MGSCFRSQVPDRRTHPVILTRVMHCSHAPTSPRPRAPGYIAVLLGVAPGLGQRSALPLGLLCVTKFAPNRAKMATCDASPTWLDRLQLPFAVHAAAVDA